MGLTILVVLLAAVTLTVTPGAAADDPVDACKEMLMQPSGNVPPECRPRALGSAWDEARRTYTAVEDAITDAIEAFQLAP